MQNPDIDIIISSIITVITPTEPTFLSFLKLNSRPNAKSRNTIPISLHVLTLFVSTANGKYEKYGPIRKPAVKYPRTSGCFNHLNKTVAIHAVASINAKSENKF